MSEALPRLSSLNFVRQNIENSFASDIPPCPASGGPGKAVSNQTIKSMLKTSLKEIRDIDYMFCAAEDCAVVYFSVDGTQVFTTDQIRESVYQKEAHNPNTLICYCFQHSIGNIKDASKSERQAILDDIKTGTKAEQCACDLRNPQGSCCLGNVSKIIKKFEKAEKNPKIPV